MLSILALVIASTTARAQTDKKDTSVYEIRSYHITADQLDNYKTWISTGALAHIREKMDVVGFWIKGDHEAEVNGAPLDELGPANVTWVIRWPSKEARDQQIEGVFGSEEFQAIFAKFPGGGDAYQRVEVRFFDAY